jgi:mRNA-degrading endonuclease RelE of RelBE toxin-antitoxin system
MPPTFRNVDRSPEFRRDIARLRKRYRTIEEDVENLLRFSLIAFHKADIDTGGIVRLSRVGFENPRIYKVRKFACRAMKGKGSHSGIRVIYSYEPEADRIEFIEIYYKGDQESESTDRILRRAPKKE